jgi:hypothetical protein
VYLSKLFRKVGAKDRFELALVGMKNVFSGQIELSPDPVARASPCRRGRQPVQTAH